MAGGEEVEDLGLGGGVSRDGRGERVGKRGRGGLEGEDL